MSQDVVIAGYQGPRSILTRGLSMFAEVSLSSAKLVPDVTAEGLSAQSLFDGIEQGEYAVGYMASGYLAGSVPELGVLDIPFSVSDRDHAFSRLDGEAGRQLSEAVAAKTDLVVLAFWDNGFRHLTNATRPIQSPEDCRGLKVRTLNNQLYQDTMAAIGFEPVVTDVKELVAAVEKGVVDAQENPITNMLTFGLDRWHKHVSLTGHIFGIVLLVANRNWFDALDDAERANIMIGAQKATEFQRALAKEEDRVGLQELGARNIDVLRSDQIDMDAFRNAVAVVRKQALSTVPATLIKTYLK